MEGRDEDEEGDDGEEEIDEDDLKMYEQFLAANSQKQQHDYLQHHIGNNGAGHQNISNIIAGESQEEAVEEPKQGGEEDE
jgi:hypothetical protein